MKAALLEYLKARTGGTVPISLKQTWEEVTAAPAFTGLLNETYGSGAEAAYSTRRLNGNVTDCMVIRRASDSTTTTIGFDGSGNISEADIISFCTGTTCTVYQWLDQSGNGNTATAPSTGQEPTIYTGGALIKKDGKVALDFDGADDYLSTADGVLNEPRVTIFNTVSADVVTGTNISYSLPQVSGVHTSPYGRLWLAQRDTVDANIRLNGGATSVSKVINHNRQLFALNSNQGELHVSGTNTAGFNGTLITYPNVVPFVIGANGGGGESWTGEMQEIIAYPSDKSTSDRTQIESNIGDYFTQNTPLLDTYTGAACAYSLRLLDSTYTGALVNVWNGTSYADIYPNVFGELDTVALAAHCGSNDGFIRYWYDQSSNSNDLVQTTTSQMPKIYDGSTGVLKDSNNRVYADCNTAILYNATTVAQPYTVFAAVQLSSNFQRVAGAGPDWSPSTYMRFASPTTLTGTNAVTFNQRQLFTALANGTSSAMWYDGTADATGDAGTNSYTTGGTTFTRSIASNGTPRAYEFIIYPSDQSSNRTNIEDNINTFYNIY